MLTNVAHKLREKAELAVLRRKQSTSLRLRQIFMDRHGIEVGLYSYGCFDQWRMPGPMRIGRWCSFASTVRSALINHPLDAITTHPALFERQFGVVDTDIVREVPLIIEDDVWIGHNAVILPSCKFIGRGTCVGAGAIVTRDLPAYSIAAGNPARIIRSRFPDDMIAALEASQWWLLDAAGLRALVAEQPELAFHPTPELLDAWTRAARR